MIDSHQQLDIIEALEQQPIAVREQIVEVSVDMWGGFPKVVEKVFPNATLVIDRFHVMQAANKELNKIRRQVRVFDRGSKFLLLRNGVDLTEAERQALEQILQRSKRLRKAYESKEELRAIYESPLTVESGRLHLEEWLNRAQKIYSEVTTTIRRHLDGICNYFRARTTSEPMEGINNRIKLIKRQAVQHSGQFLSANGRMRVPGLFRSDLGNEKSRVSALGKKSVRTIGCYYSGLKKSLFFEDCHGSQLV